MATPAASNSASGGGGGMSSNPFPGDHSTAGTCLDDPNFATICSFLQNFGEIVRIGHVPFDDLQQWLENTVDVPPPLVRLHLTLLRRVFKTVSVDKWERSLAKFGHMYCSQDAWEIERFGYKKAKIQTKLNILKNLCEAQFDFNVKFKSEVNKLQAADLRLTPLGRDTEGQLYWYQVDADANLRVYREDIDDKTWEIVASTKEELVELISQLQRGEVRKPEPEAIILPEEDSNSKDGISPKEIILDTGKVEEEEDEDSSEQESQQSGDSEEKNPSAEVKKVEPLLLRNVFSGMNKLQANQVTIVDNSAMDKGKEEGRKGDPSSETKPGIKMVFGMKAKPTLETLFPPPAPALDKVSEETAALNKPSSDQTDLSRLEETVAKLSERHFAIIPKSEPKEERTMKSDSPKDKQVRREVDVQNMNENAVDNMIGPRVFPKSETVTSARGRDKLSATPAPPQKTGDKEEASKTLSLEKKDTAVKRESDLKNNHIPVKVDITSQNIEKKSASEPESGPAILAKDSLTSHSPNPIAKIIQSTPQADSPNFRPVKPEPMEVDEITPEVENEMSVVPKITKEVTGQGKELVTSISITTNSKSTEPVTKLDETAEKLSPPGKVTSEVNKTAELEAPTSLRPVPSVPEQDKDKMPLPSEEPSVPEAETESNKPEVEPTPVVEQTVEKSRALVCGEEALPAPVVEQMVEKSRALVCGEEALPAPVVEQTVEKSRALVCGEEALPAPVVEQMVEKSVAFVCGEESKSIEEPMVTKEVAWVCGSNKDGSKQSSKDEVDAKDISLTAAHEPSSTKAVVNEKRNVREIDPPKKVEEKIAEVLPINTGESSCDAILTDSNRHQPSPEIETAKSSPPSKLKSSLVLYPDSSESSNDACDSDNHSKIASATTSKAEEDSKSGKGESAATTPAIMKQVQEQEKTNKGNATGNGSITLSHRGAISEDLKEVDITDRKEMDSKSKCTSDLTSDKRESKKENEPLEKSVTMAECSNSTAAAEKKSSESEPEKANQSSSNPEPVSKSEKVTAPPDSTKEVTSSVDDNISATSAMQETKAVEATAKRKAEKDIEPSSKIPRLEKETELEQVKEAEVDAPPTAPAELPFNPIIGETIEEEVMTITGEGSGALNEGSNENSPVPLAAADVPGSQDDESMESEDASREAFPSSRGRGGRGGRRGRGRRGRPPGIPSGGRSKQASGGAERGSRGGRGGLREIARLGVPLDTIDVNGENDRPVRASRRIAQIRLKEEEERRQLEEERLAQLKAAQLQKKKQAEKEKKVGASPAAKTPGKKGSGRKSFKEGQHVPDYIPEDVSESEEQSDEEEGSGSDEFSGKLGKKKKHRRKKNGKPLVKKPGSRPWATSSEEEDEEAVEEEEEYHEEEEEELVFKSDHEFSPESDLGEDADAPTSRHARTAKQDKGDLFEEGNCCKCRKGDHPEWILLCDKCDKGWHASCLRPQLWVIPEGEWFCPPCQHNMLIENLGKNLVEYEVLLKKRENEILRKQRLAYVGISLDNVLPDKEKPEENADQAEDADDERKSPRHDRQDRNERRKQRRRILLSDEDELSDDFINDRSNDGSSRSNSGVDSDEPTYRLRARRTKKAFNFKEYDDMINSALRVDDDEEVGEEGEEIGEKGEEDEANPDDDETREQKLNGEDSEPHVGGGKNEAYLKHLEKQAGQEDDETDEELLDEKERLRRKELKKGSGSHRKTKRRINDLEAYSDEEDSDDDFKASEAEDDEEELGEEGESEWSGDKMEDDSDDSIAKRAKRKERHRGLGRRQKYSDKGLVRRSTRKRRARISYDESDEEEEEEEQADKWQSDEETEEEMESESNSESDDDTWGRRKKKLAVPKSSFFSGESSSSVKAKGKGKGGVKRKKRKTDEDDVDRAWNNSARSKKEKEEVVERRTRGRKINFKDILDSGESDDEGNVRPKRRPLSDSDDSRSPSSSRKLAEEIRAENARKEKEYEQRKSKMAISSASSSSEAPGPKSEEMEEKTEKDADKTSTGDPLAEMKVIESESNDSASVNSTVVGLSVQKLPPSPATGLPISSPSPVASPVVPSPISLPPSSSPMLTMPIPSPLIPPPPLASTVGKPPKPNISLVPPPTEFSPSNDPLSAAAPPSQMNIFSQSIPPPPPIAFSKSSPGIPFPITASALGLQLGPHPNRGTAGPPMPMIPHAPAATPPTPEKKSKSKGSRRSKSEKQPQPVPMELEFALAAGKPGKGSSSPSPPALITKSSSKKHRDKEPTASTPINVPNPALLMSGGGVSLPDMLAQGLGTPSPMRSGGGASAPNSGSSREKKGSSGNSTHHHHHHGKRESSSRGQNPSQQTTPPPVPVSQNLSPNMPIDIDRVPNPALFPGNPGMRPFHPMWVRNPGPPPGYGGPGSPMPTSLGKPPPLNTSPFTGQLGSPTRPGFPSPPPLRIPNPNTSPLQAFQHFKRDGGPLASHLYRMPPGQPQSLANILPPGMMSPHAAGAERFFGSPSPYGHPYGLLPPHSQGQHPHSLFPYDYRPPDAPPPPPFKEEPPPPRTSSSSLPTPVSSASSSPPPPPTSSASSAAAAVPSSISATAKEDGPSEFGGLVSYFSSQRSEEDMDT